MSDVTTAPPQTSFTEIPVVSAARLRTDPGAAAGLVAACHEVGFFSLVDHDLDAAFLDRYFAALEAFFALPEDVKARIDKRASRHFRGWERVGAELTDNRVDFREQLDLSTENPPYADDVLPAYLRLDGPNQWLPEDVLPGFRAVVEEFLRRAGAVADDVMAALATGLGLPATTFRDRFGERPMAFMKMISYPRTPEGEAGVNAHHDAGFLTFVLQRGVSGLQALNPDGVWVDVPPTPGALVVNLGEMLQSMTGNYLLATTHRVVATQPRFSSAYFHGPDLRATLEPLDLGPSFAEAVQASPRHRDAGFMARREELLDGRGGTASAPAAVFGEQMWNYYRRSYPDVVALSHPDLA